LIIIFSKVIAEGKDGALDKAKCITNALWVHDIVIITEHFILCRLRLLYLDGIFLNFAVIFLNLDTGVVERGLFFAKLDKVNHSGVA
jgi:hypothetical protein